jgi:X-X-X-Leu-X-X-Gly heptad repeat protein
MKNRSIRTGLFAAFLAALAMCVVPAVSAASKKSEKAQNKAIVKTAKAVKTVATGLKGVDTRLKVIEGAAPTIIDGLTKLKDAATQLKDGLTAAAAGLTTLGDAYKAVEYGRAALTPSDADLTIAAGGAATSADIPDDGNTVSVSDEAVIIAGAGATTETLDLRALIRSAESDGDTAAKTAGQAGGFLMLQNADTGVRVACTGAPNPPGILGTGPGASIVTPSGTVTNLPLKNIPGGNLRTSTVEPTGTNGTSLFPSGLPLCSFTATPGAVYRAHWSVNFVDIPTSTTPGPTE